MACRFLTFLFACLALLPFPCLPELQPPNHFWIRGTNSGARLGIGLAPGADFNKDGYSDLAFAVDTMGAHENAMAGFGLVYGNSNILSRPLLNFIPITKPRQGFGRSIAAGDFNGDGFADIAAGSRRASTLESVNGGFFVCYGSRTGLQTNSIFIPCEKTEILDFGIGITAGDFNGDRFSDAAVSGSHHTSKGKMGALFVFLGSPTGLASRASWNSLNTQYAEKLSSYPTAAGDFNGDNFTDLAVAHNQLIGSANITIFQGNLGGISENETEDLEVRTKGNVYRLTAFHDYNKDGCEELVINLTNLERRGQKNLVFIDGGKSLAKSARYNVEENLRNSDFGTSLASVGDIDQDGGPDLLVGAPQEGLNGVRSGAAFLFLSRRMIKAPAEWHFEGAMRRHAFGFVVNAAGDLNGDGIPDFAIGSGLYNSGVHSQAGRIDVFFGSADFPGGGRWIAPEEGAIEWVKTEEPVPVIASAPPPSRNYWLVGLAVALGAALLLYRRRVDLLVTAERERLARDLHDGLGASLARISLLSKSAAKESNDSALSGAVTDAVNAARQAVWLTSPANDTLENLAMFLCDHAEKLCKGTVIALHCEVQLDMPEVKLKSNVRKNVFLAVNEALTNALKHAEASHLQLGISYSAGNVMILIKDDGKGFTETSCRAGNGLLNMRHRLKEIGGKVVWSPVEPTGTSVSMTVPI